MTAKDVIKYDLDMAYMIMSSFLGDLDDAELLKRPAPKANHIAWQLGHLIASEADMLEGVCPGAAPALPADFAEKHGTASAGKDGAAHFHTKAEYLQIFGKLRDAGKAALEALPEADLDKLAPEKFRAYAPTVGCLFALIGSHPMMHVGQFAVVRRMLDKPVLM